MFESVTAEDTSGAPPALGGDGTALVLEPEAKAGPILALIAGAQRSIDLELYQLQSPAAIAPLAAAVQRGVTVRVMLEPKTVGFQNYAPVAAQLARAGITIRTTPPAFDGAHNVDHAKFMILDGSELVFGSGNLVRSGLGGNPADEFDNRDFWIRDSRRASAAEAQAVFDADWARTSTTSQSFEALVLTPDNAQAAILALIDRTHARLYLYNQSLNDDAVLSHLAQAKHAASTFTSSSACSPAWAALHRQTKLRSTSSTPRASRPPISPGTTYTARRSSATMLRSSARRTSPLVGCATIGSSAR
jgi:phosphatidylserine/phosphatidylglycerophosphate/cardiolipin synthase-like enzyme